MIPRGDSPTRAYRSGSEGFERRVASFHIAPEEAVRLVEAARDPARGEGEGFMFGVKRTVGRWYHIGQRDKLLGEATGYYVHGDTGEVRYVEDPTPIDDGKSSHDYATPAVAEALGLQSKG